jgi:hypothetical protein
MHGVHRSLESVPPEQSSTARCHANSLDRSTKTLARRFRPLFINDTPDPGERHFHGWRKQRDLCRDVRPAPKAYPIAARPLAANRCAA